MPCTREGWAKTIFQRREAEGRASGARYVLSLPAAVCVPRARQRARCKGILSRAVLKVGRRAMAGSITGVLVACVVVLV